MQSLYFDEDSPLPELRRGGAQWQFRLRRALKIDVVWGFSIQDLLVRWCHQ